MATKTTWTQNSRALAPSGRKL